MKKKSSMLCFMLMILILSLQAPLAAGSDVAAIVTSIGVSGNREVSTSEILAVIKATQVGEPLDEQKLMQDMQAITEMGYFSLVEVEPSFYLGGMRVVFKVHENPVISGVEVELDTDEVPEEALLEAMNIPIGKIFNANILTPERMQEVIDEIEYCANFLKQFHTLM